MAGIIKSDELAGHVQRVAFNFEDMTDKARDYLGDVRQQAEAILAEASQQAQAIKQRAEQEGKSAAENRAGQQLEAKVSKRFETALPALRAAASEIQQAKQVWIRQWENNVVRLAAAMAKLVVRRELERDPEISLSLIREALDLAAGSGQIRLMLHPDDQSQLCEHLERLAAELNPVGELQIVADAEIGRGGCRVETRHGTIDQGIDAQLARIAEELSVSGDKS